MLDGGIVHREKSTGLRVERPHRHRVRLEQTPVLFLRRPERFLSCLGIYDIATRSYDFCYFTRHRIADRRADRLEPDKVPVRMAKPMLGARRFAAGDCPVNRSMGRLRIVIVTQRERISAD